MSYPRSLRFYDSISYVYSEQKLCTSSWLLLREFVRQYREAERRALADDKLQDDIGLPSLSYYKARQIMTRGDFIEGQSDDEVYYVLLTVITELDRLNIVSIDVSSHPSIPAYLYIYDLIQTKHNVKPDSMVLLHAAVEVVESEGFDELLDSVRGRIDEIESFQRTRELTVRTKVARQLE